MTSAFYWTLFIVCAVCVFHQVSLQVEACQCAHCGPRICNNACAVDCAACCKCCVYFEGRMGKRDPSLAFIDNWVNRKEYAPELGQYDLDTESRPEVARRAELEYLEGGAPRQEVLAKALHQLSERKRGKSERVHDQREYELLGER